MSYYVNGGATAGTTATVFESQSCDGALWRVRQGTERGRDRPRVSLDRGTVQSGARYAFLTEATAEKRAVGAVLASHEQPPTKTTVHGLCQPMRGAYAARTTSLGKILER